MYCQNCGSKLPESAKFCPNCGTKVYTEPTTPRKSSEEVPFTINNIKEEEPKTKVTTQTKTQATTQTKPQTTANKPAKKKNIGCTAMIFILLAIALLFAGILFIYTHLANPKNALLPENATADTIAATNNDANFTEEDDADINMTAEEAALRRRVQNIYRDVFEFRNGANYEGRYCTSNLYQLIRRAKNADAAWPEANWWTFTPNFHYPTIEHIKVLQSATNSAIVKVTIRPVRNSQIVSEVTLYMANEDGAWLIDDFRSQGQSVKYSARKLIEESEIRAEIMREMRDTLQ